jgi:hypothetical protein
MWKYSVVDGCGCAGGWMTWRHAPGAAAALCGCSRSGLMARSSLDRNEQPRTPVHTQATTGHTSHDESPTGHSFRLTFDHVCWPTRNAFKGLLPLKGAWSARPGRTQSCMCGNSPCKRRSNFEHLQNVQLAASASTVTRGQELALTTVSVAGQSQQQWQGRGKAELVHSCDEGGSSRVTPLQQQLITVYMA